MGGGAWGDVNGCFCFTSEKHDFKFCTQEQSLHADVSQPMRTFIQNVEIGAK